MKRPTRVRECPLLSKYFIGDAKNLEDWQRRVCLECIVLPICVLELSGRVPRILNEKLANTNIPCPSCQGDSIKWKEVMGGARISNLFKNKDGWKCIHCGFQIYKKRRKLLIK